MSTIPKAILNVHSASRNYGDTSQFTINLGSNCPKPKSMSLLSAEIPQTVFNVHNLTNKLQLALTSAVTGKEVVKYSSSQVVLQFDIYRATGTYAPATLDPITTFEQWQSFVNTANRDFRYAYNTTTGQQLTKKTPIAQVSITFNNPPTNAYMDADKLAETFTPLIITQLSGSTLTIDEQVSFRFQFNSTTRQYEIYFRSPKLYLETVSNTTSSFNPVLGILGGGFGGVYLPTQPISQSFKYSITVSETNFTGATLAAAVQAALNTAAASDTAWLSSTPFTCTYNSTNHKITLQANKLSGVNPVLATDLLININYTLSPLDDILGFKSTQPASNPYIGSGLVNLANNSVIYLWCDKASALNISSTGENQYILQKIQMGNFGEYSYYNSYDPELTKFNIGDGTGADFSQISFSLRNERGQVLPNNGAEWSCSILLYF
jgi:hypothetical protein